MHVAGLPTWALTASGSNAPETVFDAQNPTIMAMVHTYSQNAGVIGKETQAVISNIHAVGAASAAQAQAADQRREASSAAYDSHMDAIGSQSKAFEDYTLDRSVVSGRARHRRQQLRRFIGTGQSKPIRDRSQSKPHQGPGLLSPYDRSQRRM
jgi:hypothetical protein